jgi:hypothetical protein
VSRLIRTRYGRISMPPALKRGDVMELEAQDVNALLKSIGLKANAGAGAPAEGDGGARPTRPPHAKQGPGQGKPNARRGRRGGRPQGLRPVDGNVASPDAPAGARPPGQHAKPKGAPGQKRNKRRGKPGQPGQGPQVGGPRPGGQRKGEGAPGQKAGSKRRGRRGPGGQPLTSASGLPPGMRPGKQRLRRGQRAMQSSIRDEREYREPSISSLHAPKPGNPSPRITLKKRRTIDVPPEDES